MALNRTYIHQFGQANERTDKVIFRGPFAPKNYAKKITFRPWIIFTWNNLRNTASQLSYRTFIRPSYGNTIYGQVIFRGHYVPKLIKAKYIIGCETSLWVLMSVCRSVLWSVIISSFTSHAPIGTLVYVYVYGIKEIKNLRISLPSSNESV